MKHVRISKTGADILNDPELLNEISKATLLFKEHMVIRGEEVIVSCKGKSVKIKSATHPNNLKSTNESKRKRT